MTDARKVDRACLPRRLARLNSIYSSINIYCPVDTTGFDKAVKGNRPLGLATFK